MRQHRLWILLLVLCIVLPAPLGPVEAADRLPLTVRALKRAYLEESEEVRIYAAYAQKAREEEYAGIARLFAALRASETIHQRNFGRLLQVLGEVPPMLDGEAVKTVSTRKNLQAAASRELEDIDEDYPEMLELLAPEGHGEARRFLSYAWSSEKRHRDLIADILKGSSRLFFGLVVAKTEAIPGYFVCDTCGYVLLEPPTEECPVCYSPPTVFFRVE